MVRNILIFVLILMYVCCADNAKILGYFFIPSFSHQMMFQAIWKDLSLRGHQVTVISPNVLNDPSLSNLTEIDVSFSYNNHRWRSLHSSLVNRNNPFTRKIFTNEVILDVILEQFKHEPVRQLFEDKTMEFDVILLQALHPIVYALAGRFRAPFIGISSMDVFLETHDAIGNPTHPVLYPDLLSTSESELPFPDRVSSLLYHLWLRIYYFWYYIPALDGIAKDYFGKDLPPLPEIEKNLSLLIRNVNPIIHDVRANVPTAIDVSQIHIVKPKPLPKDLKSYLDSAKEGFIYFSLGSNLKSSNLSQELRKTIIETFSELPFKVLWKWETDHLPDQPDNVVVRKWLPQQDVLGHPNIQAFITQCGVQSLEEAIANEVPMVAMPFIGDQLGNSKRTEDLGISIKVNYRTLTKAIFKEAILEVARNKKYKENIQKVRQFLEDQPIRGLEKAIWWIEYVIRNNGTKLLRSRSADIVFYKNYMLDVIAFLSIIVAVIIVTIIKLIRLLVRPNKRKLKIS